MPKPSLLLLNLFCLFFLTLPFGFGTNWTVTSAADNGPGSLRQLVFDAQSGDTITFAISDSIVLRSQVNVDKDIHIWGPANELQVLSGNDSNRIFFIQPGNTVSLENLELRNASALDDIIPGGGAISNRGFLTLRNCYFHHNRAGYGGALTCGIPGLVSSMVMYDCTFAYNTAIYPDPAGTPNQAPQGGGAIYGNGNEQGAVDIDAFNCTFAHNKARLAGGAIYMLGTFEVANQASFEGTNCTIVYNQGGESGALGALGAPVYRFTNCILAENSGDLPNYGGSIKSFGHNLIDRSTGIFFESSGSPEPTDILDVDAKIGQLGFNGGLLPTVPISCTSPALDNGWDNQAPALDQRGKSRIGTSDIGAVEFEEAFDTQIANLNPDGPASLPQAIALACPNDTLSLDQLDGTIYLDRTILIDKSINLWGNPQQMIRIHGQDSVRLFEILHGQSVQMRWLNLSHGGPDNYGGGAILNKGNLLLRESTLAFNHALSGGAIGNYGQGDTARLTAINCTFSHNSATDLDGGAIDNRFIDQPAFVELIHCTLAENQALNRGGGLNSSTGTEATLQNTLLAHNQASEGKDAWGSLAATGPNLISNSQGISLNSSFSDLLDLDPQLDPLFSYGGPTPTHRLAAGSPAIDAGINLSQPTTDQRGEARIFNGTADLGAYEYDPATELEEELAPTRVTVFPNPNAGRFSLRFQQPVNEFSWQILDLQGRVLAADILQQWGQDEYPILVTGAEAGIYLLVVRFSGGMQTFRIQVQ
jgi:predicted outer membrane repeat protein